MQDFYRKAIYEPIYVDLYTRWFRALITHEEGAVIHCAAGKDRTGMGCALTLLLLGVEEDIVMGGLSPDQQGCAA